LVIRAAELRVGDCACLCGLSVEHLGFRLALVIAGSLKIAYDLMLLYTCRNVHPPEEIR
jgi:hypothetical protein